MIATVIYINIIYIKAKNYVTLTNLVGKKPVLLNLFVNDCWLYEHHGGISEMNSNLGDRVKNQFRI